MIYTHLTVGERCQIYALVGKLCTVREMGAPLGRLVKSGTDDHGTEFTHHREVSGEETQLERRWTDTAVPSHGFISFGYDP